MPVHRWTRLVAIAATSGLFCAFHATHAERAACQDGESVFATPAALNDCLSTEARL
jgi:hypothetical protein